MLEGEVAIHFGHIKLVKTFYKINTEKLSVQQYMNNQRYHSGQF